MSVLQDLMTVIDYLARQKTLPPKEQEAFDRLHTIVDRKVPREAVELELPLGEPVANFEHPGDAQRKFS